jgi:hypothetical protein
MCMHRALGSGLVGAPLATAFTLSSFYPGRGMLDQLTDEEREAHVGTSEAQSA